MPRVAQVSSRPMANRVVTPLVLATLTRARTSIDSLGDQRRSAMGVGLISAELLVFRITLASIC